MDGGHPGRRAAELLGWIVVASVGAVMITQAFGWDGTRIVSTLQALTPYGVPLVVLVAAAAVWNGRDGLASAAAAVGLGALLLATPLVFPPDQPDPEPAASGVRAVAVNLLYSNERVDELADELAEVDADVIVFSEYTLEHETALRAHSLASRYPHQVNRDGLYAGGMGVWSKYPVDENERIDTTNYTVDATLDGPDGTIRLFAVHPPTPIFDHDGWTHDLALIGDSAARADDPTLVIGDFNASYWHPAFRDLLRRGFTDAHMANGAGWSTSWPTDGFIPPFVRLDHTLTGNGLVSTDVDDFHLTGSDHTAFVVTVKPAAR